MPLVVLPEPVPPAEQVRLAYDALKGLVGLHVQNGNKRLARVYTLETYDGKQSVRLTKLAILCQFCRTLRVGSLSDEAMLEMRDGLALAHLLFRSLPLGDDFKDSPTFARIRGAIQACDMECAL